MSELRQAIGNNLDWYEVEAETWGIEFTRSADCWFTAESVPPFHSNLVTAAEDPIALIERLRDVIPGEWSINDARSCLDLEPLGFEIKFDAQWYWRPSHSEWPWSRQETGGVIRRARTAIELETWVEAWGETPPGEVVFRPRIVEHDHVEFLHLESDSRVLGGLACNRSEEVVGISNQFGDRDAVARCIAEVAARHPTKPLVGYGRESELSRMGELGFRALGDLRVWSFRPRGG